MNKRIKVGTRESILAVKQATIVMDAIKKNNPYIECELITIKTKGDKILNQTLDKIGGKGLFIKELEESLISKEIDIAVHSYKDMPYEEAEGLSIVALSKREAPFDVLVLPKDIENLDIKKPVGSSSLRRSIQFKEIYKGFEIKPVRGNVITRLNKLDDGEYSAIILAQAGLNRLSLENRISKVFKVEEMIPSASQGILAVQGRIGEDYSYLRAFHDRESEIVSKAERRYLKTLNGGCSSPVAVYGEVYEDKIILTGMYVDDFGNIKKGSIHGNIYDAENIGESLALMLKKKVV